MSGVFIGGSGRRDVVERDRQLHARPQQRVERVHPERRVERGRDRRVDVDQALQRRRRVDDPRAHRQPLEPERLAGVEQRRRRVLVDLDDAGFALGGGLAALGALDHPGRRDAHAATSKTVFTRPCAGGLRRLVERLLERAQRPAAVDQPAGLQRPRELDRRREVVLVAVRAAQFELAQPRRGEVGLQLAGHADEHDPPARTRDRDRLLDARAGPHAVKYTVEASKQQLAVAVADQPARIRDPRALDVEAIGAEHVVGAEPARGGLLARSAWRRRSASRDGALSRTAASVSSPIVPAPMIATFSPGWTSAIARGVQRARERLDQHRVLVGRGRRAPRATASGGRPAPRSSRRRCRGRSRSAGRRRCRRRWCCGTARAGPSRTPGSGGVMPRTSHPSAGCTTTRSPASASRRRSRARG